MSEKTISSLRPSLSPAPMTMSSNNKHPISDDSVIAQLLASKLNFLEQTRGDATRSRHYQPTYNYGTSPSSHIPSNIEELMAASSFAGLNENIKMPLVKEQWLQNAPMNNQFQQQQLIYSKLPLNTQEFNRSPTDAVQYANSNSNSYSSISNDKYPTRYNNLDSNSYANSYRPQLFAESSKPFTSEQPFYSSSNYITSNTNAPNSYTHQPMMHNSTLGFYQSLLTNA